MLVKDTIQDYNRIKNIVKKISRNDYLELHWMLLYGKMFSKPLYFNVKQYGKIFYFVTVIYTSFLSCDIRVNNSYATAATTNKLSELIVNLRVRLCFTMSMHLCFR